jgi:hypothetical protein
MVSDTARTTRANEGTRLRRLRDVAARLFALFALLLVVPGVQEALQLVADSECCEDDCSDCSDCPAGCCLKHPAVYAPLAPKASLVAVRPAAARHPSSGARTVRGDATTGYACGYRTSPFRPPAG